MKKLSLITLVLVLAALVFTACVPPTPQVVEKTVVETKIVEVEKAAEVRTVRVGLSWNEKIHSLIQAWQDYMQQYGEEYGKRNNIQFEWIINVADGDPARQAANVEDMINQGVDVIVARAQDAAAIWRCALASNSNGASRRGVGLAADADSRGGVGNAADPVCGPTARAGDTFHPAAFR